MIVFGLLSSVFDILTFLTLRLGFQASATLSRSGWFIESTITELAVILVLPSSRTFCQSRALDRSGWCRAVRTRSRAWPTLRIRYVPWAPPSPLAGRGQ